MRKGDLLGKPWFSYEWQYTNVSNVEKRSHQML